MMLVVTGIGGLIVLYSNGYMAGEDEERRYFAYMAFFVFSMLLLVAAIGGVVLGMRSRAEQEADKAEAAP
jgi:NADH-quinone oxidoreductase subunit L